MAKRSFDYMASERAEILKWFGFTCAACGMDMPQYLEVDHWVAGDSADDGVCLCGYCNRVKGKVAIPEYLRLKPKKTPQAESREEWCVRVKENQEAWVEFVNQFRGALPKYINSRKWPRFQPKW